MPVSLLLEGISTAAGEWQFAVSVVTLTELAHGLAWASSSRLARQREAFLEQVQTTALVVPINGSIAIKAGKLDGELQIRGLAADLQIC